MESFWLWRKMRRRDSFHGAAARMIFLGCLLALPRVRAEVLPEPEVCDEGGKKAQEERKFKDAIETYKNMLVLDHRPVCICALAETFCQDEDFPEAKKLGKQCLEALPNSAIANRVMNCLKHLQHDHTPTAPPASWYKRPWVWALTGSLAASVTVAVSLGVLLRPKDQFLELGIINYPRQ